MSVGVGVGVSVRAVSPSIRAGLEIYLKSLDAVTAASWLYALGHILTPFWTPFGQF